MNASDFGNDLGSQEKFEIISDLGYQEKFEIISDFIVPKSIEEATTSKPILKINGIKTDTPKRNQSVKFSTNDSDSDIDPEQYKEIVVVEKGDIYANIEQRLKKNIQNNSLDSTNIYSPLPTDKSKYCLKCIYIKK